MSRYEPGSIFTATQLSVDAWSNRNLVSIGDHNKDPVRQEAVRIGLAFGGHLAARPIGWCMKARRNARNCERLPQYSEYT